jgi:hypothetical protein
VDTVFATLALMLDSLPSIGRIVLLSGLLSVAVTVFARALRRNGIKGVNVIYRKAALVALLVVPLAVYVFNVRMPVTVDEVTPVSMAIPTLVTYAVVLLWSFGFVYQAHGLLRRVRKTKVLAGPASESGELRSRLAHWRNRLNYEPKIEFVCTGSETAWHIGGFGRLSRPVIVLPGAARHWPKGVVDVMLLTQLAGLKQRAWLWLVFGRLVQALYWPTPWVGGLVDDLAKHLVNPTRSLAQSALRDPDGWRRDWRNYEQRAATLDEVVLGELVRLPDCGAEEFEVDESSTSARERRARRWKERTRDPHEQAYWLLAAACILVATATTLTRVPTPPERDFVPLSQQWEVTMFRTVAEYGADEEPSDEPPKKNE